MEMRVVAKQIVKPSSPTPETLKTHKLSALDQLSPSIYIPLIFFYEHDDSPEEISTRLKQSLSEILTVFYPLAGTLNEKSPLVDCDDAGAEFVETRVHGRRLAQLIQNPRMEELQQLVHADATAILSVKISFFDCGGVSVGVCLSHKVGDAASLVAFMNAWAASFRGESSGISITHPSFDLALHFPPTPDQQDSHETTLNLGETFATKRLVFERKKIEKVRQELSAASSRVEAVSGFIWRSLIEADKGKPGWSSPMATHVVNLRPRTVPPLPDQTFGNCIGVAVAAAVSPEEAYKDVGVGYYASKLSGAIKRVDGDYIDKVIKHEKYYSTTVTQLREAGVFWTFSSWWRFPVYDVDFGWGKPLWVCTATIPFPNFVVLMGTPSGDAMEVWVNYIPDDNDDDDDNVFRRLEANYNNLLTD